MSHFQAKTHSVIHTRAKKGINVYLTEALVKEAKEMHLNISATLDDALAAAVKGKKMQQWKEDNKAGIKAFNEFLKDTGNFTDDDEYGVI